MIKLSKPVVEHVKKWNTDAIRVLQTHLDCTDWDVSCTVTNSLNEYTEALTSHICFCEVCSVPSRTRVS